MLTLTVFFPAVQAFLLSFTRYEYDITQAPQWIGWANFQRLGRDPVFWQTLRNTLFYLVGVVPVLVLIPLGLAILVNQRLRGMHWFRLFFYTPVVISMVVAGIAWKALYDANGLFNQVWGPLFTTGVRGLARLLPGVSVEQLLILFKGWGFSETMPWLTSPQWALLSVMVVTIWKGLGYYMVIYLAGLQTIPQDLYEAAALDGSVGWRQHWDITLPLMRPYLTLVAVISAISATKVFEEVFVMTQGGPLNSSKTVVYYLYEQAFQNLEISYACTIGLVLFLVIFSLSLINLKLSKGRESVGNFTL